MDNITLKALAKINLGLDVVRRREDGYHEVRMIMQTIHLYDKLDIQKTTESGIQITSNLSYVPTNENNLVYKVGKLLMDEFDIKEGVSVHLQKRIPVAAGMAGGSSDAAAMLYGMNEIFGLGLTRQQLMDRGVKIGADVPLGERCMERVEAYYNEGLAVLDSVALPAERKQVLKEFACSLMNRKV